MRSADDTDYCEVVHKGPDNMPIREVTIKALAINKRIRRPGFQLLSLSTAGGAQHKPCLMPNPRTLYTRGYLPLLVITIALSVYFAAGQSAGGSSRGLDRDRTRTAIPQSLWSAASSNSFGTLLGSTGGGDSPPHTPFALGSFRSHSRPSTPKFSSSVLHLMPETEAEDFSTSNGHGLGLMLHPHSQATFPLSPIPASPVTPMTGTGPEHDAASFLPAPGSKKVPLASASRRASYTAQAQVAANKLRFGVPVLGRVWQRLLGGGKSRDAKPLSMSMSRAQRERERMRWWRVAWQTVWPALTLWVVLAIWTTW
jgi:hypothetical protein